MMPVVYRRFCALATTPRPGIFLDRDGVIVEEVRYLHRPSDIRYIAGALTAIASTYAMGIPAVVVTNQSGIGRGFYGWKDFAAVQKQIDADLAGCGGQFDGVWACAAHPSGIREYAHPSHPFRKPEPGMILDAARCLRLDLERSWLVGDKPCDIEAGLRAQLAGICLVATGYGAAMRLEVEGLLRQYGSSCEFFPCDSLPDAIHHILAKIGQETECLTGKF